MSTLQYVKPTDEQLEAMQGFRDLFEKLFNEMKSLPENRGLTIALQKFEESAMWLNKSITNNC
ncbi:MAG: hypothetical protein WC917_00350 [Bacilli bacterium]|jgi:hypothetical protein